ncbi:doubled motif LPXTG anchor domain-containing protein [Parablautia intestinalis]|uniref:Doubled motif LPXTG anchor domain-containing protein n=1 Tax=Parablautia intestinalis TaxID=2320100 RepID=A0A3A9B006_9FIRM|nr:doubled motif LPXTG anchor domain-containing protein [Parablautia intestinalis]RKI91975.1 doubled motif LPXTG anchor domain-containing protein [Parablautia intestinalis]
MKKKNLKKFSRRALALLIAAIMVAGSPQLVSLADEEEIGSDLTDDNSDSAGDDQSNSDPSPHSDAFDDGGSDGDVTPPDTTPEPDSQPTTDDESGASDQPADDGQPSADNPATNNQQELQDTTTVDVNGTPADVTITGTLTEDANGNTQYQGTGTVGEAPNDVNVTVSGSETTETDARNPLDPDPSGSEDKNITVTPGTDGEIHEDFNIRDQIEAEQKPTPPTEQGYQPVEEGNENSYYLPEDVQHPDENTTVTTNGTWELKENRNETGELTSYETTKVETVITETRTPNVPESMPENAEILKDETSGLEIGYRYSTTQDLGNNTIRTTIVTVINGETFSQTKDVTTTVETITLNEIKSGRVDADMSEVTTGDGHGETDVEEKDSITPGFEGTFDKKEYESKYEGMYDKDNDLIDRDGINSLAVAKITASSLNVRTGAGTAHPKYTNGAIANGTEVYIYDIDPKTGWYRIGEDAWISGDYIEIIAGTFEVKKGGCYLYSDNLKDKIDASRGTGAIVRADQMKKDSKGNIWYHINSDGNYSGWVKKSDLNPILNAEDAKDKELTQSDPKWLEDLEKDGYDCYYVGELGLESSIRADVGSSTTYRTHQFILRDKNNNKLYAYCADLNTGSKPDYRYKMVEIDDSDYWKRLINSNLPQEEQEEDAKKKQQALGNIVINGYWGMEDSDNPDEDVVGSLATLKKNLQVYLEALNSKKAEGEPRIDVEAVLQGATPGVALTATQAALWYYGNTGTDKQVNVTNFNSWKQYMGMYYDKTVKKMVGTGESTYESLDDDQKMALEQICSWLVSLKDLDDNTIGATKAPAEITKNDITNSSVTIKEKVTDNTEATMTVQQTDNKADIYKADVSFALEVTPSKLNDDLIIKIYAGEGENKVCIASKRIAGTPKTKDIEKDYDKFEEDGNVYTFRDLLLPNGTTITIELSGTRDLGNGIYIFSSEEKNGQTSQTFIGLADSHKKQAVNMSFTMKFNIEEASATITTEEKVTKAHSSSNWSTGTSSHNSYQRTINEGDDDADADDDSDADADADADSDADADVPDEPTPLTDIPTAPVPLTNIPVEETLTEISDEDVPLAGLPSRRGALVDIFDEDVPLANVPKTGDISDMWYVIAALSAAGLLCLAALDRKKRRNA